MTAEIQKQRVSPFADFPGDASEASSPFAKASDRILRIDLDGSVYAQLGAAIAHTGDIKFNRLSPLHKGIAGKALLALRPLVIAEGKGRVYCARQGWRLRLLKLSGETVNVSAEELLAFESTLDFKLFTIGEGVSAATGGVFAVKLSGTGSLVIATHGDPMVTPVTAGNDLYTDPHATVAWTEGLEPKLTVDMTWKTLVGLGGGELVQMHFSGNGEVVVQPSEDPAKLTLKKLKKLL